MNTIDDGVIDVLSDLDEVFLEKYVNGIVPDKKEMQEKLSFYSREGSLYPVLCGAASIGLGIENLLDGICSYLPLADGNCGSDLSGVVFKVERTNTNEKKVYIRLFGWEVTDIKVTLTCGEFFSPACTPADFRNVTPMVFMDALYGAKTNLLEPLHEFGLEFLRMF